MSKKTDDQRLVAQSLVSRRARLQRLLFGGAALGTAALLTLGGPIKFPDELAD